MAVRTTFFDNITYSALDVDERFAHMFTDGIIAGESGIENSLAVTAETGLKVKVNDGTYHLRGALLAVYDGGEVITLEAADTTNPRIDTIAVEYNLNSDVLNIRLVAVKGTPSADPSPAALSNTDLVCQQPLAYVRVEAGMATVGSITDARSIYSKIRARTYSYGTTLPATGNEGDIFFLIPEE